MNYPEEYILARNQLISLKAEMKQAIANGMSEDEREGIWEEIEQCWYHILDVQSDHGFELDVSIDNITEQKGDTV
tara:strand:- start:1655 stop:1879 length:225 start_codon:yes stop_codon:yes gene_type:complete